MRWLDQANQIARQGMEIEFLQREKVYLESECTRQDQRISLLETALAKEQKDHNLALRRYADQVSKQVGLPQHFVADAKPKPEEVPDPDLEARIMTLAKMQRDADIDNGENPWPLEDYANEIRKQGIENVILN